MSDGYWNGPQADTGYWYGPQPLGPSNGAHPGAPYPNGPQWATGPQPTPRPGTMWLRPQDLSDAFSVGFATLRANLRTSIGLMLLPALLGGLLIVIAVVIGALSGLFDTLADSENPPVGAIVTVVIAGLLLFVAILIAASAVQAANVYLFGQSVLGRKATARQALTKAWPRVPALLGIGLLVTACMLVPIALMGAAVAVAVANHSIAIGVLAFLVLVPLLLAAWVALAPRLSFTPYVVVLEKRGPIAALKRSWALTRGRFWRTLGFVLVISAVASFATNIVTAPFQFVTQLFNTGTRHDDEPSVGLAIVMIVLGVVFLALSVLVQALSQTFTIAGIGAVYADARIRDEGLDRQIAEITGTFQAAPPDAPVTLHPGELEFPLPR